MLVSYQVLNDDDILNLPDYVQERLNVEVDTWVMKAEFLIGEHTITVYENFANRLIVCEHFDNSGVNDVILQLSRAISTALQERISFPRVSHEACFRRIHEFL
jgi:hypothetical protein